MTEHLPYALLGALLGFVAGWSLSAFRYARRAYNDAHAVRREVGEMRRDDDGSIESFPMIALIVVVLLTAVSAIVTGYTAQQAYKANDRVEDVATCTRSILEKTVRALNERTAFSDEQAAARRDVLVSQQQLVRRLLNPKSTDAAMLAAARTYNRAVTRQLRYDNRNTRRRNLFPYPTSDEIRQCGK